MKVEDDGGKKDRSDSVIYDETVDESIEIDTRMHSDSEDGGSYRDR